MQVDLLIIEVVDDKGKSSYPFFIFLDLQL